MQPIAKPEYIGGDEKKRSLIRAATLGGATGLLIVALSFLALVPYTVGNAEPAAMSPTS